MIESADGQLCMWTVYAHPKDYPNGYVARLFRLDGPTHDAFFGDSLEEVRAFLDKCYPGLYCIPRSPNDEPQIVETWL